MRHQLWALLFLGLCSTSWAQFTTVSGTVTDPNGLPYAFGTIASVIVSSSTPVFSSNLQPYIQPTQPTGLDVTGSFLVRLADNTQLSPGGSTWTFTVCSGVGTVQPSFGKGPICFKVTGVSISGAAQSITSTLSAAAPALTVNFGNSTACSGAVINNGLLYLNGSGTCTNSANATFVDGNGAPIQPLFAIGSASIPKTGLLRFASSAGNSQIQGSVNLVPGWLSSNSGALTVGLNSNGGNLSIAPNAADVNPLTISTIARAGNVVTATFGAIVAFPSVGDLVRVAGVTDSTYNGVFRITGVCPSLSCAGGMQITWSQTAGNSSSSAGTVSLYGGGVALSNENASSAMSFVASSNAGVDSNGLPLPALLFQVPALVGGNGPGGDIAFNAGSTTSAATTASPGGNINLTAGSAISQGVSSTSPAGSINLTAGSALGGNNNGGNINLTAGGASGSGVAGKVNFGVGILNAIAGVQQNGTAIGINCGTTTSCANTAAPLMRIVYGQAPLVSGTPSTAVVTGISPAFTSTTSFECSADNNTTQANNVKIANTSTSSVTITGPNAVTDVISYICVGT
jgi:hypothetical protein